jgi:hypothetical protein
VLLAVRAGSSDCVIAAGAGHGIGKHQLLSDGICAARQRMIVPQAKKLKKEEVRLLLRGDFACDEKSKQKYLN